MTLTQQEIAEKARQFRIKNPENVREYQRKSVSKILARDPDYWRKRKPAWNHNNPAIRRAEYVATYYLKVGSECEFCGDTEKLLMHHPDYNYPLIVVTACQSCHNYIRYDEEPYVPAPDVDTSTWHCDNCRKTFPDCGKKRPSFRGRGCMLWEATK